MRPHPPLALLLLIALGLPAVEPAPAPAPGEAAAAVDDALQAELAAACERLRAALAADDGEAVAAGFASDAFADGVLAQDLLAGGGERMRPAMLAAARAMPAAIVAQGVFRWQRGAVQRVHRVGPDAVIVAYRGWAADGTASKLRLRFERVEGAWKLSDLEDVSVGIGMQTAAAIGIVGALRREPWVAKAKLLGQSGHAVAEGDIDALAAIADDLEEVRFPPQIEPLRAMVIALARIGEDDTDAALAALDGVPLSGELPGAAYLRATVLNLAGRHAEALAALAVYDEAVGVDADSHSARGDALHGLEQPIEAEAAYRAALAEAAEHEDALLGLVRVLPDARVGAAAALLPPPPLRAERLRTVAQELADEERTLALAAWVEAWRAFEPDAPDLVWFDAERRSQDGDDLSAAAILAALLAAQDLGDDRLRFLERLVEARLAEEDADAVWVALAERDRAAAFPALCSLALEAEDATLAALARTRLETVPADPWALLVVGQEEAIAGRHAEAEARFAAVTVPDDDRWGLDWQLREARLATLFALGERRRACELYATDDDGAAAVQRVAESAELAPEAVGELVDWMLARDPEDARARLWAARLAGDRGDHAGALALLRDGDEDAAVLRVRCLVRTGRADEALAFARAARDEHGDGTALMVAHALRDEREAALAAAGTHLAQHGSLFAALADPEAGPILRGWGVERLEALPRDDEPLVP